MYHKKDMKASEENEHVDVGLKLRINYSCKCQVIT